MQEIDCNFCYFASLVYRGISVCDVMANSDKTKYGLQAEAATWQQFSSFLSNDQEDKKICFLWLLNMFHGLDVND